MAETEYAVIGGGLVGMAVAFGLQVRGHQVTVFDEGDRAFRASRGNFGLVWVQGKGVALPDYARWTRLSARLWPEFQCQLLEESGVSVEFSQRGGLEIFLDDGEAQDRVDKLESLQCVLEDDYPFELLGRNALTEMAPRIGPEVVGATYFPEDGTVNPLYLLRALHQAFAKRGGRLVNGQPVSHIAYRGPGFDVQHAESWEAERVVLCAGLGNAALAPLVGLDAPVRPERGHLLITERLQPMLPYPSSRVRQVGEGAIQIGDSKEDAGLDDHTDMSIAARVAKRAIKIYPFLEAVRLVRSWAALRVMSPDGHPIYDHSRDCPGAFLVTCHSGVTLAAVHARVLAAWILGEPSPDPVPDFMESFSVRRLALQPS